MHRRQIQKRGRNPWGGTEEGPENLEERTNNFTERVKKNPIEGEFWGLWKKSK